MKKTVFAFVSSVILSVIMFSFAFSAAGAEIDAQAYTDRGYFMVDKDAYLPSDTDKDAFVFPDLSENKKWTCSGMVSEQYTRVNYGSVFYCANVKEESSDNDITGGVTYSFDLSDKKTNISDYSFLRFAVGILRNGQTCTGYFVRVKITTNTDSISAQTTVYDVNTLSGLEVVTIDTSELVGEISTVRITVLFNSMAIPEQIKISTPYLSRQTGFFDDARNYLTPYFRCEGCNLRSDSGKINLNNNGDAILSAEYAGEYLKVDGRLYLNVGLTNVSSGSMAVKIRYADSETGESRYAQSQRLSLYDDSDVYVFPFDIHGVLTSYSVVLSGIKGDDEPILEKISVKPAWTKEIYERIGEVTKIERSDDFVRFEGTIDRSAVKEYAEAEIGFFACPGYGVNGETIELGRIQITTKFEYTADVSDKLFSTDTYMLMAAVVTSDGYVIPISQPRYFDGKAYEKNQVSNLGLHGTAAVGAFESNASHVVVDVPLDELFAPYGSNELKLNYTVYGKQDGDTPYSQRTVELRKEIISSLDEEISFYISAGIRVYIRFVSDSPIPGVTYTGINADNYSVCLDNNETRHLYSSLVSFLAKRYNGLDGFVVGEDISRSDTVGCEIEKDIFGYVNMQAELYRLTYNAAARFIENPVVAVPMSDDGDCSMPELCAYIADCLEGKGNIPWTLMYVSNDFESGTDRISNIGNSLKEMGFYGVSGKMIFLKVEQENDDNGVSAKISEYCSVHTDFDAVIFSVDEELQRGNGLLYSEMKKVSNIGYVFSGYAKEVNTEDYTGEYTLCDFSDKYHTLGWRAVGVEYFGTDESVIIDLKDNTTDRVLRADFGSKDNTSAGILLKNFDKTVDMSEIDRILFEFALGSETCNTGTVVFVIGCDETRAEYSAQIATDGTRHILSCDLNDFEYRDRVDFIGVMVYADWNVSLEIKNTKLESTVLDNSSIEELFTEKEVVRSEEKNMAAVWILSIVIFIVTAVIVILIMRKEKDLRETHSVNDKKRYYIK